MTNVYALYVEFIKKQRPGSLAKTLGRIVEGIEFIKYSDSSNRSATSFLNIFGISDADNPPLRKRELETWLNNRIKAKGALEKYHRIWRERNGNNTHVDLDDLRIREYVKAERTATLNWMVHGNTQRAYQKVIEVCDNSYRSPMVLIPCGRSLCP